MIKQYFLVVAFLGLVAGTALATTKVVFPSKQAQELAAQFLDIRVAAEADTSANLRSELLQKSETILSKLLDTKTAAADEALVVLLSFYVGEATHRDLLHELSTRGKRMLPILRKYEHAQVKFSRRTYPAMLRSSEDVRAEDFVRLKSAIKSNRKLGMD